MQRGWHRLVGDAEPAVETIVGFLEHAEAVCLLVCAIDARMHKLARFVFAHPHLLLLGDESKKHASVLHCAAAHGHVAVVQWVLRHRSMRLTRKRSGNGGVTGAGGNCTSASVRPFLYTTPDSEDTVNSPRLAAMAWVNRNVPYVFPAEVMYEAARQGDASVVAWLHTTCQYATYRAMEFAATRGRLKIAQWLYDHRESALPSVPTSEVHMLVPLSTDNTNKADVMNWIAVFVKGRYFREAFATRQGLFGSYDQRDDGINWNDPAARDFHFAHRRFKAIDLAASRGDLELIKKLHADGKHWPCTALAMDGAARLGHLHVVKWLHKQRTEGCTSNAIAAAAGNGHFAVVQWLHAHRFEGCRSYAMDLTATHGHLQILQWLYIELPRFSCTQACLPCVAANNHQHVLRWLHEEKGFEFDVRTVEVAIANGHFELVQWLLKQEPSLGEQITPPSVARAAKSGNAEMTQWLVTEKQLWSSRAVASAAATANFELVQWLYDTSDGKPNDPVDSTVFFDLAKKSEFELIEWLLSHELGQPIFAQSQREFAALFGSARQPTGVNSNISKALTAPNSSFFAWDLHTKENPSWIAKYALLVLKYHPNFLMSVNSSPMLSAQRGVIEILQRLAASGHPEAFTKQTFQAMMTYTKAGDAAQWFLKATGFVFMDASVIEWATRFQLLGLLECVMTQMENVDERYRAHACETVMRTACRQGHLDLLRWGLARFESLPAAIADPALRRDTTKVRKYRQLKAALWRELSVDAAANGHMDVLEWIFISSERPRPSFILYNEAAHFQQLADAAAENGHVRVLQWAERRAWGIGALMKFRVSRAAVERVIANKHFDVVQWLVNRHHKNDLIAEFDHELREAIAACLKREMEGFLPTGSAFVLPPV